VRPFVVVIADELHEHRAQVPLVDDDQVVDACWEASAIVQDELGAVK
jgi:hypothetical protein